MSSTKVHAPNAAFTGVVAGVVFNDGVGSFDPEANPAAERYFRRQGFGVGAKAPTAETPEPTDPRDIERTGPHRMGTPLRDAAIEPHPDDFLPPTNAGEANPHGPAVVAPEIHASGPKGIKPGDVHVGDPAAQQRDETALATSILVEGEEHPSGNEPGAGESSAPAKSSSKAAWADYAVAQGMARDDADASTRAELIELYGG